MMNEDAIGRSATLLSAMADSRRLEILTLLTEGEFSVSEIAGRIGLNQSTVSRHLARLRADRLVQTRRDAQTIFYSSRSPAVFAILETLAEIYREFPI